MSCGTSVLLKIATTFTPMDQQKIQEHITRGQQYLPRDQILDQILDLHSYRIICH